MTEPLFILCLKHHIRAQWRSADRYWCQYERGDALNSSEGHWVNNKGVDKGEEPK